MTHVQTEVPRAEYERLRAVAEERGLSIREALREAAELWVETQEEIDPTDPVFTSVEAVRDDESAGDRDTTSVVDEDDLVEPWRGDASEYRLADPD